MGAPKFKYEFSKIFLHRVGVPLRVEEIAAAGQIAPVRRDGKNNYKKWSG